MKLFFSCRQFMIAVLATGMVVGCASAPEPVKEAVPAGPSPQATQAIDEAKAAIAEAKSMDALWRDTEAFLASAEKAGTGGDNDTAIKLANKARSQAELSLNQRYLEKAKVLFAGFSAVKGLSSAQRKTLAMADVAIRSAEGRKAYDLLSPR